MRPPVTANGVTAYYSIARRSQPDGRPSAALPLEKRLPRPKSNTHNLPGLRRQPGPFAHSNPDDPEDSHIVENDRHLVPALLRYLRVHEDILNFLRSLHSERLHP